MNRSQQISPEATKQYVLQAVKESGIDPMVFIQLGKLAEDVMQDKNLYPQFVDAVIRTGMADPEDFQQGMDFEMLVSLIATGRACQQMGFTPQGQV